MTFPDTEWGNPGCKMIQTVAVVVAVGMAATEVSPSVLSDDDFPAAELLIIRQLNLIQWNKVRVDGRKAQSFPAPQL
ncbi:hypothetical protein E2C01_054841 [Portunus trituberculatus]|uniref:Uncharacterized protein n=1 Tax=Portunus trituberculatus TaxID=210409 RepID=A0A5B7GTR0_PORTR|nr:hypothetical protein [Portunus trituberculatus]